MHQDELLKCIHVQKATGCIFSNKDAIWDAKLFTRMQIRMQRRMARKGHRAVGGSALESQEGPETHRGKKDAKECGGKVIWDANLR